jgi:hypothetical protein
VDTCGIREGGRSRVGLFPSRRPIPPCSLLFPTGFANPPVVTSSSTASQPVPSSRPSDSTSSIGTTDASSDDEDWDERRSSWRGNREHMAKDPEDYKRNDNDVHSPFPLSFSFVSVLPIDFTLSLSPRNGSTNNTILLAGQSRPYDPPLPLQTLSTRPTSFYL